MQPQITVRDKGFPSPAWVASERCRKLGLEALRGTWSARIRTDNAEVDLSELVHEIVDQLW